MTRGEKGFFTQEDLRDWGDPREEEWKTCTPRAQKTQGGRDARKDPRLLEFIAKFTNGISTLKHGDFTPTS